MQNNFLMWRKSFHVFLMSLVNAVNNFSSQFNRYSILNLLVSEFYLSELSREWLDGKVELREDFDKLKSQYDTLKNDYDRFKTDFDDLMDHCKWDWNENRHFKWRQCRILVRQTNEILVERNSYYSEWEHAKNLLTPR